MGFGGHPEKGSAILLAPDVHQVQAPVTEQPCLSSAQLALERRCQAPWDAQDLAVQGVDAGVSDHSETSARHDSWHQERKQQLAGSAIESYVRVLARTASEGLGLRHM